MLYRTVLFTHISCYQDSQSFQKVNKDFILLISLSLQGCGDRFVGRVTWESVASDTLSPSGGTGLVRHWTGTVADVRFENLC